MKLRVAVDGYPREGLHKSVIEERSDAAIHKCLMRKQK